MKAKLAKEAGVMTAITIAFVVVVLYSFWGAALLNTQKQAAEHNPANHLSTNI